MTDCHDVIIVGAGPYGLSIAAHLRALGLNFRIFGSPMSTWRERMPKGMVLKSDGFASNLSDPYSELTLKTFCAQKGLAYDDTLFPVPLDTFIEYGAAFQKRFVPDLENRQVTGIEGAAGAFTVQLDDGTVARARKVLLAVGITHFDYIPDHLERLPREFLTHSSAHRDPSQFRGRSVTVIGAGASAMDLAALLNESGAAVSVVARRKSLAFHSGPGPQPRPLWQRLRYPKSGIGPGLQSRFYTDAPLVFHRLPQKLRLKIVRQHLGPAAGWTIKERVMGRIPMTLGHTAQRGIIKDGKVHLTLTGADGSTKEHVTDHVIAATGYRVDVRRLSFLSEEIRGRLRSVEHIPVLSTDFQSSVPGLYFVGPAAAVSFGPLLRFAFGSDFVARRISRHLAKAGKTKLVSELAMTAAR